MPGEDRCVSDAETRTLGRLSQFWTTAAPPVSPANSTILVDLMHGHPEYLYRSLVIAKFVQLITGGRLVGLIGAPRLVTMFLEVDLESTCRLASAFGLLDTIDLTVLRDDAPTTPTSRHLARVASSGTDGQPLSPLSLERIRRVVHPDDGFPIGKTVQEVYMRSELDARLRHGKRLRHWCGRVLDFDDRVRSLVDGIDGSILFVTGHLDYHWGHIARHVVRAGGRAVHYRLDNRTPVNLIDSVREGETLNGTVRRSDATAFARFENALAESTALSRRLSPMADRLSTAVRSGLGSHFRSVTADDEGDAVEFDRSRPTFIAFAHTFTDQPVADLGLFPDHFLWLDATLTRAAEGGRFNLLVKAHPSDETYDRSGAIETLRGRFEKFSNIGFTSRRLSHASLIRNFDGGVTVRGTPGLEMTSAGLPMILAGRGAYGDCGFCLSPRDRDEYFRLLEEGVPPSFELERQSDRAKMFQAYDRFWSAPTSPLLRPYRPLPRDDAWWLRIDEAVRGADLLTDPLFLSLRRAWPDKNCRVVSTSLASAIEQTDRESPLKT